MHVCLNHEVTGKIFIMLEVFISQVPSEQKLLTLQRKSRWSSI